MKKTLILFAILGNVAFADSFTWDFEATGAQMSGSKTGGSFTTKTEIIDGVSTIVLTGSTFYELETDDLYDMIQDAYAGKSTLTFSLLVNWGGSTTAYETFLHVGAQDYGITLGACQGTLTFASGNSYDAGKITGATLTKDTWQKVEFTMFGNTTSVTIDGEKFDGKDLPSTSLKWNTTTTAENEKYSIGFNAPGYNNYTIADGGTKIANFSVKSIPEPTTATLSLLALCGLAARRRRK